jgi:hypothetical protein
MASKTKIYIVMEYATGGELFDKIVSLFFFKSHVELLVRLFVFCFFGKDSARVQNKERCA